MLQSVPGDTSLNFVGTIGKTVPAAEFPKENYIIDDSRFDAEGDWAFCRFRGDEVYAARLGFTRGTYEFSDFGYVPATTESYLLIHLQLMLKEGAVLWLSTGQFKAEQVTVAAERLDVRLPAGTQEIFSIRGWPHMRWHFRSDDGQAEADLELDLAHVTILPDNVLPRNVFSMWESIGKVSGVVKYENKRIPVAGTVFYDHSRFKVQSNAVRPRQWHIYTPMYFEDESVLVSYYTVDHRASPVKYYCFGLYMDAQGQSHWLPEVSLSSMQFDDDDLPEAWNLRLANQEIRLEIDTEVKRTSILKAWGAWETSKAPRERREFVLIPLVLDGVATEKRGHLGRKLAGHGLAEYWHMPPSK